MTDTGATAQYLQRKRDTKQIRHLYHDQDTFVRFTPYFRQWVRTGRTDKQSFGSIYDSTPTRSYTTEVKTVLSRAPSVSLRAVAHWKFPVYQTLEPPSRTRFSYSLLLPTPRLTRGPQPTRPPLFRARKNMVPRVSIPGVTESGPGARAPEYSGMPTRSQRRTLRLESVGVQTSAWWGGSFGQVYKIKVGVDQSKFRLRTTGPVHLYLVSTPG